MGPLARQFRILDEMHLVGLHVTGRLPAIIQPSASQSIQLSIFWPSLSLLTRAYSNTYRKRTGPRLILRCTVTVRVTTGGDSILFLNAWIPNIGSDILSFFRNVLLTQRGQKKVGV